MSTRARTGSTGKPVTPRRPNGLSLVATPGAAANPTANRPLTGSHIEKRPLVRDSFAMPKAEYDLLAALKARLVGLERPTKKGELLRAGIVALASMSDAELRVAVARVPNLKTGRPKKDTGTASTRRRGKDRS